MPWPRAYTTVTGDEATYVGETCPACGRAHMLLRDIRGHRRQETVVSRRGGLIPWAAVNVHDDTFVTMRSRIGPTRIVDMLSGEQRPRIC